MSDENARDAHLDTIAIHAGGHEDAHGAVVTPIYQSSTFEYPAGDRPLVYTRYGTNPTQVGVQSRLAAIEGAEDALMLSSGMAAIATALLTLCAKGDHVVAAPSLYGGTHRLLEETLPALGIEVDYADGLHPDAWRDALRPTTRVFLWEAITNPLLGVPDPAALVRVARERGVTTVVDATFATPVNQRPLDHGVDLVMHSATKYLGGHSDLIAGTLAGSREGIAAVRETMHSHGGAPDPHAAFLLDRGLKTLSLRVARQNANGAAVAGFLADHPRVERVHYPGLDGHEDREVARRFLAGCGGVVSFVPHATPDEARRITERFRWIRVAPSLGGVESLVSMPSLTSHRFWTSEQRAARGIPDAMIRLALGIEATVDLLDDLERGLAG